MTAATELDWMPAKPWSCPGGELVLPVDAPREEWLQARRSLIGASDIAAIAGASRWDDAYTVWLDKTGQVPIGEATREQERGLIFESAVIDLWRRWDIDFPIEIRRSGLMRSKLYPHIGASVDRLSVCPLGTCVVEVKTQNDTSEWAEAGEDEVPASFQLQGAGQLLATGRHHVHFVGMSHRFRTLHRVQFRDEPLIERVAQVLTDYWQTHVVGGVPPKPSGRALDLLRTLYGDPDLTAQAELPPEQYDLLERKRQADAAVKAAEAVRDDVTAELVAAFGDATTLVIDDDPVATYRPTVTIDGANSAWQKAHRELTAAYQVPATKLDVQRMVAEHPELLGVEGGLRRRRTLKML